MDKTMTFIDKNRTWFSWSTLVALLLAAAWLMQSMGNINNSMALLNANFQNFADKYDDRSIYVDDRLTDFEIRLRSCEKLTIH